MDDSHLVQELNQKNTQIEIMHSELKTYAERFDKERKRADMLGTENQQLQQKLRCSNQAPPLPPRTSANMVTIHHCFKMYHLSFLSPATY